MENGPLEDVFPIENGNNPASYVSLPEGKSFSQSCDSVILVVVSNICYVLPYLGKKKSNLTHIFQMGWFNHQLGKC